MKSIGKIPPYTDLLAEYAVKNYMSKGFDPQDTKYTLLTVSAGEDTPVFQQSVVDGKGRHLLDCWKIFRLAKMIQDDSQRSFSKIKIRIDFEEGEVKMVRYSVYPLQQ